MSFGARATIRLDALAHNLSVIRKAEPDARIMAVIKANAYGHGIVPIAERLEAVDSLAVARLPEAALLRDRGIDKPIVLLEGVTTAAELAEAFSLSLELVVHSPEQIAMLRDFSVGQFTIWLKFDTGMNRLGFPPEEAADRIASVADLRSVKELRLMTHLANADLPGSPVTETQLRRFESVVSGFDGAVSIANSPATFGVDDIRWAPKRLGFSGEHWLRPGLALFGISPFDDVTAADLGLRPVMQFEARLIAKKPLAAGEPVGYRGRYVSQSATTLGIIAAGYGDGYTRHFRDGTPVLLNHRRVALIGNVSMDMMAVDLGPNADDEVGDVATLWGDGLPVEEVAPWADAIPYELVCGVVNREDSVIID